MIILRWVCILGKKLVLCSCRVLKTESFFSNLSKELWLYSKKRVERMVYNLLDLLICVRKKLLIRSENNIRDPFSRL